MSIEPSILKLFETVKDPYTNLTAKEMNLHTALESSSNSLQLHLTAGFPCQFLEKDFKPLLIKKLAEMFPQYQLSIEIKQQIRAHKTQMVGKGLRGVKNTIAVASGKGGVGKSTVTVNLAAALSRLGARVGVLDADIYGPSIPLMLGHSEPVAMSGDYYLPVQAQGLQAMSIGYLTQGDQSLIWRGPMLAKALIQMLDITLWDDLDYLFIDLPPGTGDIQLTLVQKIPLTTAIIVTTPQAVATLDAQKAITMFQKTGIQVLGLIENMSVHSCSHCGHQEPIFGEGGAKELCDKNQIPLLGQLPLNSQIRAHCDAGFPTALQNSTSAELFFKSALHAAIALAHEPINYADTFNVKVE